jgi:hypothetical protein
MMPLSQYFDIPGIGHIAFWVSNRRNAHSRSELAHLRNSLRINLIKKPTPTALDVRTHGGQEAKKLI